MIYSYRVIANVVIIDSTTQEQKNREERVLAIDINTNSVRFLTIAKEESFAKAVLSSIEQVIKDTLKEDLAEGLDVLVYVKGVTFLGSFEV
jgi:hypothetical protein